ncbi:hypothetical protein [Rhizobium sp. SSA_523]|uniref:hypothetical protein n=1 Tax=Rhizobium sp. SSA_523 TaxID=2952477 RepID=UPI002091B0A7|nr:hypothetical protein [Rhizobium sp. SSA_523]MCO5730058.1 hypothetical protein [Rhizobium sp. SSA_523]WKC25124.1 hypothetical protein QTJ18_14140 [Rhizobium sp. SSA_523]
MELEQFEIQLAEIIGRPTNLRPFVCEGSPLDCSVFIVGYNPATKLDGDWWRFWTPGHGYEKRQWLDEYLAQRKEVSKTRARMQHIGDQLRGYNILEANIDARPSAKKSEYPRPITEPFDFLMSACRPKLVIAHGVDAVEHLQQWKDRCAVIECSHFIYVGKARAAEIVAEAKEVLYS